MGAIAEKLSAKVLPKWASYKIVKNFHRWIVLYKRNYIPKLLRARVVQQALKQGQFNRLSTLLWVVYTYIKIFLSKHTF